MLHYNILHRPGSAVRAHERPRASQISAQRADQVSISAFLAAEMPPLLPDPRVWADLGASTRVAIPPNLSTLKTRSSGAGRVAACEIAAATTWTGVVFIG